MNLFLGASGELFIIDLDRVCFFQSDDHYAHVYYDNQVHFMIPFGLSSLENSIRELQEEGSFLVRIGRKYIVNLRKVIYINLLRQEVLFATIVGEQYGIKISKLAIKELMNRVRNEYNCFKLNGEKCLASPPNS